MTLQSLKTNIAVSLAAILLTAMFLIDFVMVATEQRRYILSEVAKGKLLISLIARNLSNATAEHIVLPENLKKDFEYLIKETDFQYAAVIDRKKDLVFSYLADNYPAENSADLTMTKKLVPEIKVQLTGSTWGVFWQKKRYLVISRPLFVNGRLAAAVTVTQDLKGYYKKMRHSQRFIFMYLIINTIVLTILGFLRMSRITLKPVSRLVKRAEEYTNEDGFSFLQEKEINEFGMLSRSLNQMLKRISDDKGMLKTSLVSLKQANIDLKKAQSEIVRAEKLASVGRLSAGIAHEIGNPIGIVLGYLELLKQGMISKDEQKDYILRAEKEINRINTIIRQLLDFSRPTAEVTESVSIHKMIHEVTDILKVQPIMADITIEHTLEAEDDTVLADPDQLRQVVLNLLINASDAMAAAENRTDGNITIKTRIVSETAEDESDKHRMLEVSFIDNGHGIARKNLENIFDPFFTTKSPGKGTGLGLSVSFMIIDQAGGTIKAESKEEKGTTMTVSLPLEADIKKDKLHPNDNGEEK